MIMEGVLHGIQAALGLAILTAWIARIPTKEEYDYDLKRKEGIKRINKVYGYEKYKEDETL